MIHAFIKKGCFLGFGQFNDYFTKTTANQKMLMMFP